MGILRLSSFVFRRSIIPCVRAKQKRSYLPRAVAAPILCARRHLARYRRPPGLSGASMPNSSLVSKLVKSDRRKQWTELKSKHKAALAAKKVDFGAKFGAALDKYQLQLKATDKLLAAETLNQAAVDKILVFARPLSNVADHYLMLVKGLGDPAEKELAAFLKGVVADCNAWEQVSNIFEQSDVPAVTAAQLAAVKGLYGPLDRLSGQLENLGKSFTSAQAELKSGRNKGVKPVSNNIKMSSADWAALKNLPPDQWA